jgi:hypothetical protein
MSAVSIMPTIPSQFTELFKNAQFVEALQDWLTNSGIIEALGLEFDLRLIKEHNLIKRVAELEKTTGLVDYSDVDFSEEQEPSIPEQIKELTQKVNRLQENSTSEIAIIPRTTLEHKATELALYVRDAATKTGKMFLDSKEQMHFFKYGLSESLRMGNIQNPRQFKKDVIDKAKSMFPFIDLDKKKNGRRDVRVVYKPVNDCNSLNRTDPYIRLKPT